VEELVVASVAEFQERLQELEPEERGYLFRGQANAAWRVHSSAARRLSDNSVCPINQQLISHLLVGYLETMIAKAKLRNYVPPGLPSDASDLEFLAHLQHQGAATGLIDFTRQPLVALWFACNDIRAKDGAVFLLRRSATVDISDLATLKNNIEFFYGEDKLWSWEPSSFRERILTQKSVFVFGLPWIDSDRLTKITIRAESKTRIIEHLESFCGINEEELHPDYSGFAIANASTKPFDAKRTIPYWQKQIEQSSDDLEKAKAYYKYGVAFDAIGEPAKAIEQYDEAAKLNPRDANTFINRGNAKADLGNTDEAIADYAAAIEVDPECAAAFNNRGQSKAILGLHEEAIADFDATLRITLDNAEVYYKRGLARKDLRQFESAKKDFEHAKILAQEQGLRELLSCLEHELKSLNFKPFQVISHSSEFVPGVDPARLKEKIYELDDELFIKKSGK